MLGDTVLGDRMCKYLCCILTDSVHVLRTGTARSYGNSVRVLWGIHGYPVAVLTCSPTNPAGSLLPLDPLQHLFSTFLDESPSD